MPQDKKDAAQVMSDLHHYGVWETYCQFPEGAEFPEWAIHEVCNHKRMRAELAANLIKEEVVLELLPALQRWISSSSMENLTEVADGAIDSIYVILQLMHTLDLPFNRLFAEVHANNLSKLQRDAEGKLLKRADGKILKPEGHKPPNLLAILLDHSRDRAHELKRQGADNWGALPKQHLNVKDL